MRADIEAWIKRITYKPNVTFHLRSENYTFGTHTIVQIVARVPNVLQPNSMAEIMSTVQIHDSCRTYDHFIHMMEDGLRNHEMHELTEWFKSDGVQVRDPHPELTSAIPYNKR
jgi:hypothetical protein